MKLKADVSQLISSVDITVPICIVTKVLILWPSFLVLSRMCDKLFTYQGCFMTKIDLFYRLDCDHLSVILRGYLWLNK